MSGRQRRKLHGAIFPARAQFARLAAGDRALALWRPLIPAAAFPGTLSWGFVKAQNRHKAAPFSRFLYAFDLDKSPVIKWGKGVLKNKKMFCFSAGKKGEKCCIQVTG
jgi:hypothetical protein